MKNILQKIERGARIGLVTLMIPSIVGLSGCGENETFCETYQGFHREGSENIYVFDPETREGRQTKNTNRFNQSEVSEREAKYKISGEVAFGDSMEIGKRYCVTVKTSPLFADRIISVKPVEDLK